MCFGLASCGNSNNPGDDNPNPGNDNPTVEFASEDPEDIDEDDSFDMTM